MSERLALFLKATDSTEPEAVALRALTLHMLRHLAPRLFAEHQLAALQTEALARCADVPFDFDAEDPDVLQAGIDAWFCRHVAGLPHPKPDADKLRARLQALDDDGLLIYAWLLGEIAARCGVDVRVPLLKPRPYAGTSRLHDTYWLTHLPMLHSDYFAKPLTHPQKNEWADALAAAVPWLQRQPNDDLAGEVALCLRVLGRDATAALKLFSDHAPPDDAHAQATALLALSVEEPLQGCGRKLAR